MFHYTNTLLSYFELFYSLSSTLSFFSPSCFYSHIPLCIQKHYLLLVSLQAQIVWTLQLITSIIFISTAMFVEN